MDPFSILGVAASIIACVQLTKELLKRVGPSDHSKKDLHAISRAICGFQGAYEGLKTYLELHEEDGTRLSALQHLEEPLRDCKHILDFVKRRLQSHNFVGHYIVGTLWDAKMRRNLKRLEDAKTLFEIALSADQRIILSAVERYVRNAAEDVRDLATHVNDNGKRLLDLDEHSREQSKKATTWHKETKTAMDVISEHVLAHDSATKEQHQNIEDGLNQIRYDVKNHSHECKIEEEKKKKDEILRRLSSTDPTINQNAAWESHEPQTGKWFLCGDEYSQWKETPQSFLWIHGIAGCGKTVLFSTIVQDLVEYCNAYCTIDKNDKQTCSLGYFYCSFTDVKKQKPHNLISSLLAQLVRNLPSIPETLSQLHSQYKEGMLPINHMKEELQSILKHSRETFLIVDALDECPISDDDESRPKILALLTEISQWALPNLHVLITSRKEPDIEEALTSLVHLSSMSIQNNQVQPDIHKYIKSQLANDLKLKKWSPLIKEEIENTLVEQAHGMFRWVFCQINSLKKCIRPRDVRDALKCLPKTLDDFYARTLLGIDESYRQMTINALQWLAFSKRPLRIEELAEAVIIDPNATLSFDQTERLFDSHDVLRVLSSLVTVHKIRLETEEIRLAHFSVKEYLVSNRPKPANLSHFFVTEAAADQFIAESCLLYIKSFPDMEHQHLMKKKLLEFPLMNYSCRHWRDHVNDVQFENSKAFADLVFELFTSKSKCQARLLIFNSGNPAWSRGHKWAVECDSSPESLFHNACCLNLDQTVQQLLNLKQDVHGSTFVAVVERGWKTIVDRLLKAGADVKILSRENRTALHAAARYGHKTILDSLLKAGADVKILSHLDGTALYAAARNGHETIVDALLKAGADVNIRCLPYGTALHAASNNGHETTVDALLKAGADVNILCEPYETALHAASSNGHETIVDILLKAGADVNILSEHCGTALSAAARYGHETIMDSLLKAGADVNILSHYCGTALYRAASFGHETIVDRLLKADADVNILSEHCGTALSAAAGCGHETIVDALLKAGADVNILPEHCGTALSAAARNGHETIVNTLLKAGADVDISCEPSECNGTALYAASNNGHEMIVDALLKAGADVNIWGMPHGTALHAASAYGHRTIVNTLLKAGADVNIWPRNNRTALPVAVANGHEPPIISPFQKPLVPQYVSYPTLGPQVRRGG